MILHRLTEAEFDLLREEWNALVDDSASDCVFLRWEWTHTWWSIFRKDRTLFILTVRSEGRLVGIAPFFIEPTSFPKPRCLRFCSDELSPDYLDIIVAKGQEDLVAREIGEYVANHADEWDVICLDNLREGSPLLRNGLFGELAHSSKVSFACPYIKIQGNFEDYLRSRTEAAKYDLDKKYKRLFRNPQVKHFILKDPASLPRCMNDLFALRSVRSAIKRVHSTFVDGDVKRFHEEISRLFLEEGILNLQLIYDGEKPASVAYAFNYKKKIYFFQTAFSPDYKAWSAGGVLFRLVLQQAFDEGYAEFDTLKGNEFYKTLWSDAVRQEMNLTVYSQTLRGQAWRRMRRIKNLLRGIKRQLFPRSR